MTDNDADRIRDAIQREQTSCRCGHLLAACADCRDWLAEHSPRIAAGWRWYVGHVVGFAYLPAGARLADTCEAEDRAYFGL